MAEDFQEQVHSLQGFEIRKKRKNVFIDELARGSDRELSFHTRATTRAWLLLRMSRILFAAKTDLDSIYA